MSLKHKQSLRSFTYVCLSLASIIFSSETQAGSSSSNNSSNIEESEGSSNRNRRLPGRAQREENEQGITNNFHAATTQLLLRTNEEDDRINRLITVAITTIVNFLLPNMQEEKRNTLINDIIHIFNL